MAANTTIVEDMDALITDLLRAAKSGKTTGAAEPMSLGEKLRIADIGTKWVTAKNRLDDQDASAGIDALKRRLSGEERASDADRKPRRTVGTPITILSRRGPRPKSEHGEAPGAGSKLDKLKKRLPGANVRHRRNNSGDSGRALVDDDGAGRGVRAGLSDDTGPDHAETAG